MPYWRRREVLSQNLARYSDLYPNLRMEIIVVDDGSPEPPDVSGEYPWPVRLISLPPKQHALNPSVPINRGVAAADGEVIVLTGPEVVHRSQILAAMRGKLAELGPTGYVGAACWGGKWWYCHSTLMPEPSSVGRAKMPDGAPLHFCTMLHRQFFNEVGGFDEEYRDGLGYEDNDFLWALASHGAQFAICDDLVTDHLPCPRSQWPAGGAARNRAIFERKWP